MRIVIIEPDPLSYSHLVNLLQAAEPGVEITAHLKSLRESMVWFKKHTLPDLVFSVINLPDGISFELFNKLDRKLPVIYTCSNEKYARDAFNTTGIYYLLKPFVSQDLHEAINKFKSGFPNVYQEKNGQVLPFQKRFLVHVGRLTKMVPAEDIAYFYTDKKVVYLVCFDNSKYTINTTLEKLETQLNPENFFRINRQFIVNLSSIMRMIPASKSRQQLLLKPTPAHTPITSFNRTQNFYKWLTGKH